MLCARKVRLGFEGSLKKVVASRLRIALRFLAPTAYGEDGGGDKHLAIYIRHEVAKRRAAYAKAFTSGA
eukprot:CAMPEP_0183478504 /NCGR_PEP_ID=MMETSP0370-20130417/170031_1 /TAXON_ID=268820 /ORGANISM="Peridinium aciculiferum, Strain PAER-2" /LENGTH=68 /DNA_ID=CAMNT_0025671465 /DNA_START=17 /DNA_END=219 /DNA_ORIENTATION=+